MKILEVYSGGLTFRVNLDTRKSVGYTSILTGDKLMVYEGEVWSTRGNKLWSGVFDAPPVSSNLSSSDKRMLGRAVYYQAYGQSSVITESVLNKQAEREYGANGINVTIKRRKGLYGKPSSRKLLSAHEWEENERLAEMGAEHRSETRRRHRKIRRSLPIGKLRP